MDTLTRDDLDALLAAEHACCLSLYMPAHRTGGPEIREDVTRFSNLMREAEEQLKDRGCPPLERQEVARYLKGLHDDSLFWQHQADGLAVFVAGEMRKVYRLPMRFTQLVSAGPRFDVTPLLPLLQGNGRFYVLAVSQNKVRLLEGDRYAAREVETDALPENLRDALNIDEYQQSLQFFSVKGADIGGGPRGQAIYHGHGGSDQGVRKTDELLQFFRRIDNGLNVLFGVERTPLVFAGVEYLFPIFKEACDYNEMVDEPIPGNPDHKDAKELHDRAWPLVEGRFLTGRDKELDRLAAAATPSSHNPREIITAARAGRVGTLFLVEGGRLRGDVADAGAGEESTGEEDLLNLAAIETLRHGGRVFTVPAERIPSGGLLAARLRYATTAAGTSG